jgi:hypothetical protein
MVVSTGSTTGFSVTRNARFRAQTSTFDYIFFTHGVAPLFLGCLVQQSKIQG